jgi:hypothetical protein
MPFYIVVKQDTVLQITEYVVRAEDPKHAAKCVDNGMFVCESAVEIVDVVDTDTVSVTELVEGPTPVHLVKGEKQ